MVVREGGLYVAGHHYCVRRCSQALNYSFQLPMYPKTGQNIEKKSRVGVYVIMRFSIKQIRFLPFHETPITHATPINQSIGYDNALKKLSTLIRLLS